ncbi:farnesol dehydrogenase [Zeugodacus cucurbitae]|uniref:Dehydrogenase/reductase SDR family member 11 n=1 Tax=Zeugodacus cucurbitae TaxID=28588 RepID=A0A0A1XGI2_ZEUCU|nr:farnesol dehydrogenase [Zeugodacus cucurbitae]
MERWHNRVAVVTGASSGIGAAIVKYLANNGMIVVGLARRVERIEALRNAVAAEARKRIHAIGCNICNEHEVIAAFKEIASKYGPVAVLVNNAGIVRNSTLLADGNTQDIRDIIETNILGVVYATREAFRAMKAHGGDGHVFLMNSIAGHQVPILGKISMSIYAPTKHAVTALTEVYRQEFNNERSKVKITSLSPGFVETEIVTPHMRDSLKDFSRLHADDVADALIYCLQTPPHVQIHELTIKPLGELF